jgi:myo-inositol-1(or 4)-monophosphatase
MENILDQKKHFSHVAQIAIDAALLAGEVLRRGFGTDFSIFSKEGKHNLVTDYDYLAEKTIIDFIKEKVPESYFLAEESGKTGSEEALLWVIDPLDGTVNFAHRIPFFSVSIAVEKQGRIIAGVVFQPLHHELFVAELGKGAFLNGKKLKISPVDDLQKAMLATGFPYNLSENPFHCIEHFIDIIKLGIPIRRIGSAAIELAYVAAGRIEGFFEVGLSPWDCAAGKLLIEEAGGSVTHWDQTPFDIHSHLPILASNGLIHKTVARILNRDVLP